MFCFWRRRKSPAEPSDRDWARRQHERFVTELGELKAGTRQKTTPVMNMWVRCSGGTIYVHTSSRTGECHQMVIDFAAAQRMVEGRLHLR